MKTCPICNKVIKLRTVVNGKVINCQRRKYCFDCSPLGSGNNKAIKCDVIAGEKEEAKKRKNKDQYRKYQKRLRLERKIKLVEMLGGKCERCGYDKSVKALDFHHKDPKEKSFNLANLGYTCKWERLVAEAKKCTLLCANCHRELN